MRKRVSRLAKHRKSEPAGTVILFNELISNFEFYEVFVLKWNIVMPSYFPRGRRRNATSSFQLDRILRFSICLIYLTVMDWTPDVSKTCAL